MSSSFLKYAWSILLFANNPFPLEDGALYPVFELEKTANANTALSDMLL
jgi:hypothetical protein